MKDEIKQMYRRMALGMQFPPFYLYAYEQGYVEPYQFFFYPWQRKKMWLLVHSLRARGFRVNIWRPERF